MSVRVPTLAEILVDQAALYEELLGVLTEEEAALIRGDSEAVAATLPRKDSLTVRIRLLEMSRQATVLRLTGRADTRLRDLPNADAGELGTARARLTAVLHRVERANRRVEALLTRALSRLRNTLELVHDALGGGRRYTATAQLVTAGARTLDGRV
jgi:flagellar biosynthesis/type III secretory pathway chaperone